jgi:copper(I)-binding protein
MPMTNFRGALGAAAFIALSAPAFAHASLETTEAPANAACKAVVRVSHGCKGEATRTFRIQIPEGVIDVKPMPKAGWTLTTSRAAYDRAYDLHGKRVPEGVKEIVWTGELPDAFYDEFVFRARIVGEAAGKTLPFPVVQLKAAAATMKMAQAAAASRTYKVGAIVIEAPWSRVTPGGAKVAGGYMRITNTGSEPDRLLGGAVPVSGKLEIHEASMQGDLMRMRPLEQGLELKPGQTVEFKPGRHHLMFVDLKRPLKEGEIVKGTLVFEKAGTVAVVYAVRAIGARGSGHEHHH